MLEWFNNTAQSAITIHHPSVVKILSATYSYDGTAYIVMEFIDGINLDQLLAKERVLSLSRVREFVKQISAALHAAHLKNIIHGNLNPHSVMLLNSYEANDRLKTGNFFLYNELVRKLIDTRQKSEFQMPFYDAPEYINGERVDYRADIYSLGVLVYFMLTGELPFQSTSTINYLLQTLQAAPRPLRTLNNSIPQAIEDVVLRSLAKNPTYRQQTALQFANEFDDAFLDC